MAASSTVGHCLGRSCHSLQNAVPCIHQYRHIAASILRCRHHSLAAPQAGLQAVAQQQRQQQQGLLSRRAGVIAAAGRRGRRPRDEQPEQAAAAAADDDDDEPELDLDDVMYGTDEMEGEDDVEGEAEDTPEEPDFEEEDEDDYEFGDEDEFEDLDEAGEGEDLEGWDAALANFDPAQDAAQPVAPSKEEQERRAALAMVRFQEDDEEDADAPSVEVLEVPEAVEIRPKTFDEATADLAPADKEALMQNGQSYASFPMDGVDLLVSETPDGRMVLSDAFLLNQYNEMFSRPTISEDIPTQPQLYQLLPWEHTQLGDTLKRIDRKVTLVKMYFVAVSSVQPWTPDLQQVYSFDSWTKEFVKHEVKTLGDNVVDPVLRIREDGVFIEDSARVPGAAFVAEGFAGHPEEQYTNPDKEFNIRDYVRMGWWPEQGMQYGDEPYDQKALLPSAADAAAEEALIDERLEDLELMEELDDMPDVPAVDMV